MSDETVAEGVANQSPDPVLERIQALSQENSARLERIAALHPEQAPSDAVLLKQRLDTLVDFLIGPSIRVAFEAAYQQNLSTFIDNYEKHVLHSGLVVPGQ